MDNDKKLQTTHITLTQVAADAGVSRATASLVVRNSPLITAKTRDQVLASMGKLGYVYNRSAASLRTLSSQTIGLVVFDITHPFVAELTEGIETRLGEANYITLLGHSAENPTKQDHLLSTMREYRADGLIVCPAQGTSVEMLARLRDWHVPFVLVVRYIDTDPANEVDYDYVGADNRLGGEMATAHLIAHGHRRIAFIGGPLYSSARRDRLQGYCRVLEQHGIAVDTRLITSSPSTREGRQVGYQAILDLLHEPDPPTAAFCHNDVVAFGVMLGLQASGRTPGRDFAVVGFDDISEAAQWRPALTSVAITPRRMGDEAASLLIEKINAPAALPRRVILPPNLSVRETCGPNCPLQEGSGSA